MELSENDLSTGAAIVAFIVIVMAIILVVIKRRRGGDKDGNLSPTPTPSPSPSPSPTPTPSPSLNPGDAYCGIDTFFNPSTQKCEVDPEYDNSDPGTGLKFGSDHMEFHGVICGDTKSISDMEELYKPEDSSEDWNTLLNSSTEGYVGNAYGICKKHQDDGCEGIYIPSKSSPEGEEVAFVFDTTKCLDDPEYREGEKNPDYYGTLHFRRRISCKEGYINTGNACRTEQLSDCDDDRACGMDEMCLKGEDDVPICLPLEFFQKIRKRVENGDSSIISHEQLETMDDDDLLDFIKERYPNETINRETQKVTNDGGGERIFCYNGGQSIAGQGSKSQHQYCICNLGDTYDKAAWGGARCDVKCPVWIDKQRERLEQIKNTEGQNVTIPRPSAAQLNDGREPGAYGYMLKPLKRRVKTAAGPIEFPNDEYDAFFASTPSDPGRSTLDPSIQICGNELTPDGTLIRRGTCVQMNPLHPSELDSHCACMAHKANPELGCRLDECAPKCDPFATEDDGFTGSCAWVPTTFAEEYSKYGDEFLNEPEDGMRRCDCDTVQLPYKKFEIDAQGDAEPLIAVRPYPYDTEYSFNYGKIMKSTAYRECTDPCAIHACGWQGNKQYDKDAVCGIEYDLPEGWGRGMYKNKKTFCKCSADWKGPLCTEPNECPMHIEDPTWNFGSPCGAATDRGVCIKGHTIERKDDGTVFKGTKFTPFTQNQRQGKSDMPKTAANAAQCSCNEGFAGFNCGASDKDHCFGNGKVNNELSGIDESGVGVIVCDCCDGAVGKRCDKTDKYNCHDRGEVYLIKDDELDDGELTGCRCRKDYNGVNCQFSRKYTCKDHGDPDPSGACTCDRGWSGKQCTVPPACPFQTAHDSAEKPGNRCVREFMSPTEWLNAEDAHLGGNHRVAYSHMVTERGNPDKGTSNVCKFGWGSFNRPGYYRDWGAFGVTKRHNDGCKENVDKEGDVTCGVSKVFKTRPDDWYEDLENNPYDTWNICNAYDVKELSGEYDKAYGLQKRDRNHDRSTGRDTCYVDEQDYEDNRTLPAGQNHWGQTTHNETVEDWRANNTCECDLVVTPLWHNHDPDNDPVVADLNAEVGAGTASRPCSVKTADHDQRPADNVNLFECAQTSVSGFCAPLEDGGVETPTSHWNTKPGTGQYLVLPNKKILGGIYEADNESDFPDDDRNLNEEKIRYSARSCD